MLKYDAHINVEVCCSVSSVKYLYKYVYKGPDRAMTCVCGENDAIDVDEIQNFQDSRCIGACEACWRIFEFHLYERSPPVEALCVHLPNEHQTLLAEGGSVVPESDEGESSGDECGSAAAEAASDSESESSLLEQAIRAAGVRCAGRRQ